MGQQPTRSHLHSSPFTGDMDHILETVMCAEIADEPRFHDKIKQWISEGTVPPFTFVSVETKKKRQARKKRWEAEAEEAKRLGAEMEGGEGERGRRREG